MSWYRSQRRHRDCPRAWYRGCSRRKSSCWPGCPPLRPARAQWPPSPWWCRRQALLGARVMAGVRVMAGAGEAAWQLARCQALRTGSGIDTPHPAGTPPSPARVQECPALLVKTPVPAPSWNRRSTAPGACAAGLKLTMAQSRPSMARGPSTAAGTMPAISATGMPRSRANSAVRSRWVAGLRLERAAGTPVLVAAPADPATAQLAASAATRARITSRRDFMRISPLLVRAY